MMNRKLILVAETGSDLTPELAKRWGVYLVPMHVNMGDQMLDDGAFPVEEVCAYYERTGKAPKTSASSPEDFTRIFDEIHAAYPDKHILHLAYSAVTTCSYQNALLASEDRDYVTSFDTQHVSVGQAAVVIGVAKKLQENPDMTLEEAVAAAKEISACTHMCFIPNNLDYLRAGGRVSNAVAIAGNLLQLHPCIDIIDGKLMAQKKYRGSFQRVVPKLIEDYAEKYSLNKEFIRFIDTPGLEQEIRDLAENTARSLGFKEIEWMRTGCVITCHGGPKAFGIVGSSEA